ncbi:hypothetical protein C0J52_15840 [Blattella germanica]|nr:hypothetical protein C0J52_15840 [Blattella germanica]
MDVKFKVDHMIKANCQNGVCHPPQKYGTWAMFVFAPVDVCHSPIECISCCEEEFLDRCSGEAGVTKQFQLQIGAFHRSTVLDSYSEDFADLLYAVFNETNSALLHTLKISLDCCLKTTFTPFPGMSQDIQQGSTLVQWLSRQQSSQCIYWLQDGNSIPLYYLWLQYGGSRSRPLHILCSVYFYMLPVLLL